jgi:hypothetical protein
MNTSFFSIVRFTVAESTYHAVVSGNPETRRALRFVEWGSRDTEAGEMLVTPPLRAEEAATLRAVFAGAEGVSEVDATGEYVFAYTSAPASYDGFGTLSVSVDGDERLVAIETQYLNWQASRYASGLHRFRPAAPAPTSTEPSTATASVATVDPKAPQPTVGTGTVVHMHGRARRYVVVRIETFGDTRRLGMIALSGSLRGCFPTSVSPNDVEHDPDQTVAFTGAAAITLRRKYDEVRRSQIDAPQMTSTP